METFEDVNYSFVNGNSQRTRKLCNLSFFTETKTLFYYCALISAWDDRSWYFLVGIYLVILDPTNLVLTAVYGFLSSGIVLVFGSVIGSWADRTSRRKGSFIIINIRNMSTLISSICLYLVIWYHELIFETDQAPRLRVLAKVILIFFAILAHICGLVNNNMLTKDWLPILCIKDSQLLAKMTAKFRLIDLVSNIVAPIIIGQIMTFAGRSVAIIIFSVQVILSLILFCLLLHIIYERLPRLHYREDVEVQDNNDFEYTPIMQDEDGSEVPPPNCSSRRNYKYYKKCAILVEGWITYFKHTILWAGLGLALLYMTVLGFDSVTIGYAISQGMKEFELSFFNAGAALTGIMGALIYPYVLKKTNIIYTGIIALLCQFTGLIPCILSVWASGSPFNLIPSIVPMNISVPNSTYPSSTPAVPHQSWTVSIILLMSGIISSRVGLWMFDLTISQLLVETVKESDRGKINGVQISLNMLFNMIKFAMVLLLPLPRQFGLLIILSVGAVASGNILYWVFAAKNKYKISSRL